MIKKQDTNRIYLNYASLFMSNIFFDMEKLRKITNISARELNMLMIPFIFKYIFGTKSHYSDFVKSAKYFKLCPICINERKIPLFHNFDRVSTCIEHNIKLIDRCNCGKRISLFSKDMQVFHCPFCNLHYNKLEKKPVWKSDPEYKKAKHLNTLFSKLYYEYRALGIENGGIPYGFLNTLLYPYKIGKGIVNNIEMIFSITGS